MYFQADLIVSMALCKANGFMQHNKNNNRLFGVVFFRLK